jgi:hypothetical protein
MTPLIKINNFKNSKDFYKIMFGVGFFIFIIALWYLFFIFNNRHNQKLNFIEETPKSEIGLGGSKELDFTELTKYSNKSVTIPESHLYPQLVTVFSASELSQLESAYNFYYFEVIDISNINNYLGYKDYKSYTSGFVELTFLGNNSFIDLYISLLNSSVQDSSKFNPLLVKTDYLSSEAHEKHVAVYEKDADLVVNIYNLYLGEQPIFFKDDYFSVVVTYDNKNNSTSVRLPNFFPNKITFSKLDLAPSTNILPLTYVTYIEPKGVRKVSTDLPIMFDYSKEDFIFIESSASVVYVYNSDESTFTPILTKKATLTDPIKNNMFGGFFVFGYLGGETNL